MAQEKKSISQIETYLNFAEYQVYSMNPVSQTVFDKLIVKATLQLNYFTNNRIKNLDTVPDEVKYTLSEFVDVLNVAQEQIAQTGSLNLASYSNGIESFSFNTNTDNPEKSLKKMLYSRAVENLSAYPELLYRGIR